MSDTLDKKLQTLQSAMRRNAELTRPTGWYSSLWGACAFCVTSSGAGILAGHLGCVVTPLLVTLAPASSSMLGVDPYNPVLMLKIAAGVNAAVLAGWYGLRGRHVSRPIQMATVGFALAGLVATTAIKTPHMVDMQLAYEQLTQGDANKRAEVIETARMMGQSLDEHLMAYCSSPTSPTARVSSWQKIRLAFMP
ncbi:MAG: hypothetical protein K2X64_07540 [Rhodocyclaceae bacterium]|nr:hypothetical protein [Rhodocyclaceae bacterium]